ncbi:MAG: phosphatase family protein [Ferruginibacter sp.]|nr:phosphatase family protein [Ferruginibacter sp.]
MKENVQHNISRVKNRIKLLSIELGIVLLAFLSSCGIIVFLVKRVFYDRKENFDNRVFAYLKQHVNEQNTGLMQVFTFFGSHYFLVPANLLLMAYAAFYKKDRWFAIKTASVAVSSLLLMFSLKFFFNRKRPLSPLLGEVPGLSFPSGHAFMSFTFFGLLIYMVNKKTDHPLLRWLLIFFFLAMIAMVCISRIYLRVHYATDVLAGLSLGMIWLVISLWTVHIIERDKTRLPAVH